MENTLLHINEAILVEGKYDKIKLSSIVDALIVETNGFSVYNDSEKREYIRMLAAERGLIVLTDSDNAGRQIRNYIASFIPAEQLHHAYIPDIYGKERRKAVPSKEGKLGVEGISAEIIRNSLMDAGVSVSAGIGRSTPLLSISDCLELGLTGCDGSSELRKSVLKELNLPENLTLKMLLRWVDNEEKLDRLLTAVRNLSST